MRVKYIEIVRIWIFLFISLLCNGLFAASLDEVSLYIQGKVTSADGTPVFATVFLKHTNKYIHTSENGTYKLEVAPGTHTLVASSVGYKTFESVVKVQTNMKHFDITLQPLVEELEDVVVVGKSESRKEREKGFLLSSVNAGKAALNNLETSELLNRVSGVKLRQSGGVGSEIQYNINGLTGNSIRIFIDGVPMENYGSSFSVSSIPPSIIERIDVYKGVVPAHLADDALGGAINIVLKQSATQSISTSYTFGSLNSHKWDLNANFRNQKTGFTVQGAAFFNHSDNNYKVWGDQIKVTDSQTGKVEKIKAERFHDGYQSKGLTLTVGFTRVNWADKFLVNFLYSDMKKDIQHGATMEVVYGNRKTKQHTYMGKMRYEKKNLLPNLDVSAHLAYASGERMVIDTIPYMYNWTGEIMTDRYGNPILWKKNGGEAGRATLAANQEKTLTGRARISYEFLQKQTLSLNYFYTKFTRDIDDPYLTEAEQRFTDTRHLAKGVLSAAYDTQLWDDRIQASLFYKYYRQKVRLTDPVVKNGELVADEYKGTIHDHGVGGAFSFQLVPKIRLTSSLEYATRLPGVTELLGNTSMNIEPTYGLQSEKSTNINVGLLLGTFRRGQHEIDSDVNFFYRDIKDMIQKALTNTTDEMYGFENLGKIKGKGIDCEIRYNYKHLLYSNFKLSYTDTRFNLRYDSHGTEYIYYKDRLRNDPYFTFNWDAEYKISDCFWKRASLSFNYNMGYVHEFYRNWESLGGAGKAIIPSQLVHDLGLLYTFPKKQLSFGLDVKNLTNEQVFDNWALQRPGRMILFKLSYTLSKL